MQSYNRLLPDPYDFNKKYHFVKFNVNTESITLTSHQEYELKNFNLLDSIILPLSFFGRRLPYGGKIICGKIISISIWDNHSIMLSDNEKGSIVFSEYDNALPYPILNSYENWSKLLNLLEKHLFPHLVNNIVRKILENEEIEISKPYGLKVSMTGIYLGGKFIDLENVNCKFNLKKWEVKISNKKNIFQSKKIGTNEENIIILPYLIDYLKIIHHQ